MNAQGEDVVAGIRTPLPVETLAQESPRAWRELLRVQKLLERHFRDMQDVEFTIEDGKLWMLQCRTGKRTGIAAVRIASTWCARRDHAERGAAARRSASARPAPPAGFRAEELAARAGRPFLTRGCTPAGRRVGTIAFSANAARDAASAARR
jgi:pyruvate,orthophosphate dikinase